MMDVKYIRCMLMAAALLCAITFNSNYRFQKSMASLRNRIVFTASNNGPIPANPCVEAAMSTTGVPSFKTRNNLAGILEMEKLTSGVELGVQSGNFARHNLKSWPSCKSYLLVDLWAHQEHYDDSANHNQRRQDGLYQKTLQRTSEFTDKVQICRNYTSSCVLGIPDDTFDFIYIDARHDFKGVYEDMVAWWPKLRVGGIMSGHDYVSQDDGPSQTGQNWTLNYDGTVDETGTVVKGAVDKFSAEVCRQLTISYREQGWNSWAMRK